MSYTLSCLPRERIGIYFNLLRVSQNHHHVCPYVPATYTIIVKRQLSYNTFLRHVCLVSHNKGSLNFLVFLVPLPAFVVFPSLLSPKNSSCYFLQLYAFIPPLPAMRWETLLEFGRTSEL